MYETGILIGLALVFIVTYFVVRGRNTDSPLDKLVFYLLSGFDYVSRPDGTHLRVSHNYKWGIYSIETNSLVVPIAFDDLRRLTTDLYEVRMGDAENERRGIFSIETGWLVVPVEFEDIRRKSGAVFELRKDGETVGTFCTETREAVLGAQ